MTPPTLQEAEAYVKLRNLSVDITQFLMHYEDSEPAWTNKNGKPIKNWKLTMQTWHFGNMRRADTHRCSYVGCKAYGVYVYKDDCSYPFWRCVEHKRKLKPFISKAKADEVLPRTIKLEKINKNNRVNELRKGLGL